MATQRNPVSKNKKKKKQKKTTKKKKEDITWTDVTGGCAEHLLLSLSKVII